MPFFLLFNILFFLTCSWNNTSFYLTAQDSRPESNTQRQEETNQEEGGFLGSAKMMQNNDNPMSMGSVQPEDAIVGVWYGNVDKDGCIPVIEIFEYDGKYYGCAFASKDKNRDFSLHLDINNPDPKLRKRHRKDIIFLKDLAYNSEKNSWEGGTVYEPDTGRTFQIQHCNLEKEQNILNISLYNSDKILKENKNLEWLRVSNSNSSRFAEKRVPLPILVKKISEN